MNNAIHTLRIQNFKSIKDVEMKPRRVNIIIGEPNVGKSNILEAVSLLGAGLYEGGGKFLSDVIRYETTNNLFYDNDTSYSISVEANTGTAVLTANESNDNRYRFVQVSEEIWEAYESPHYFSNIKKSEQTFREIAKLNLQDERLKSVINSPKVQNINYSFAQAEIEDSGEGRNFQARYYTPTALPRKYTFRAGQSHSQSWRYSFLQPPFGQNIFRVVQKSPTLRKETAVLFKPYGLSLVLRVSENKFEIQKQVEDLVYNYPYSLIADTLQRIIFYLAAIESNDDAVLLFEEPEAHSYPEYVIQLAEHIVDSRNNQFFVVTHSPYLVTEVLEEMVPDDELLPELAVFVAYYEDYQTKIRQLSDEEVITARSNGTELFLNLRQFVPGYEG